MTAGEDIHWPEQSKNCVKDDLTVKAVRTLAPN